MDLKVVSLTEVHLLQLIHPDNDLLHCLNQLQKVQSLLLPFYPNRLIFTFFKAQLLQEIH